MGAYVDRITQQTRSLIMSRVKAKNTTPELRVRKIAYALGYRFRIHRRDLPGTPDLVFPKLRLILFVHGCFWHRHNGCVRATTPRSNYDFWQKKLDRNVERDRQAVSDLAAMGWDARIIWECETKDAAMLATQLRELFESRLNDLHLKREPSQNNRS
jgi:DNA mismatch endonuclease (patch repair protein)